MQLQPKFARPSFWRSLLQWGFLAWTAFLGVQFGLFARHFTSGGRTPAYLRPPGVEGFLPIGGMVSLKNWLLTGRIDPVHPAALILLVTIVVVSLLTKKSFCSWICPIGTLSEGFARVGSRFLGRNLRLWPWLDGLLRGGKYLLLLFFLKLIWLDMPEPAVAGFLASPYWAVSDVRMLHFFTAMSVTTLVVLLVLAALSLPLRHFWCRYLCPYGALLGLVSLLSPFKIRRNPQHCTGCEACSAACPSRLPVHRRHTIRSPECTGCLSCLGACCHPPALQMAPPFRRRTFPWWGFVVTLVFLFAGGVGIGMASGHWQSSLSTAQLQVLIPQASRFGH